MVGIWAKRGCLDSSGGREDRTTRNSKVTGGYEVDPAAALTGQTVANNALKSHKGSCFPFGHNVESLQSYNQHLTSINKQKSTFK